VTSTFPSSDARRDEVRNQVGLLFERQVLNTVRMDAQVYYQARVNRFHSLYEKDRHENNAAGMEVLARWIVHPAVLMTAGAELRRDGLESTKFNHLQRHTQSFNAQVEIDHALNAFGWRTQWKWIPALRQDRTRAGKANLCPKIGVLFRPFPFSDFSLKANAGKSFRLPTFNDLYWPELVIPGWGGVRGNSALKPETGFNADAGIVYRTKAPGMFAVECTAFQNSLHDLILWESDEQLVYAPRNVGSARITGLETEFTYRTPGEHWDFAVAPTWMRARDLTVPGKAVRLVYRPDFKLDASAGFRFGAFRFRVQARAVDTRYTRADNSKRLPSYWTMGGNVQFEHRIFGGQFRSKLEMNNAFDRSIYIIEGYPTPGREFRFTLGLDR
jgi:outer membrane cobalamin receptor